MTPLRSACVLLLLSPCAVTTRSEVTTASAATRSADSVALARALEGVSVDRLRADLSFLASDEMGGRDTPSAGLERAARTLTQRLDDLGFAPGARDGYLYHWSRSWRQIDADESRLTFQHDGEDWSCAYGVDYFLVGPRELADLDVRGPAISVGDGSVDEVQASDLRGRWAVCRWPTGSILVVARRVSDAGGVGLVVLPGDDDPADRLRRSTEALVEGRFDEVKGDVFPTPVLSRAAAARLLQPDGGRLPAAGTALGVGVHERRRATHPGGLRLFDNVCGLWPGSDPELRGEVLVVSAHYDHVGTTRGEVYNGADDNASGTSGLLAIAEALTRYGPLRRSVLLTWVCAEEKGLWGSEAWTRRPWLPEGFRPVCDINIDMIGRNAPDDLCITPTRRLREGTNGLVRLAEELAPLEGFGELRSADEYWRRSDHMNFAVHLGLPVTFLFADVHEDYHKPTDDPDKIDYDKVRRVTRLVLRMLDGLQSDVLDLGVRPAPGTEEFQEKVRAGWIASDLERLVAASLAHARAHAGRWPSGERELDLSDPAVAHLLRGALPVDPWGHPYAYEAEAGPAWVCLGRDGVPGGTGEDADSSLSLAGR